MVIRREDQIALAARVGAVNDARPIQPWDAPDARIKGVGLQVGAICARNQAERLLIAQGAEILRAEFDKHLSSPDKIRSIYADYTQFSWLFYFSNVICIPAFSRRRFSSRNGPRRCSRWLAKADKTMGYRVPVILGLGATAPFGCLPVPVEPVEVKPFRVEDPADPTHHVLVLRMAASTENV